MFHVIEWFLFGMFAWCCVMCISAVSRRLAPETGQSNGHQRRGRRSFGHNQDGPAPAATQDDPRTLEIRDLRKRIETLEAIITDRRYQWDEEYSRD